MTARLETDAIIGRAAEALSHLNGLMVHLNFKQTSHKRLLSLKS